MTSTESKYQVALGTSSTCILNRITGSVKCFGMNDKGKLGYGIDTTPVGQNITNICNYLPINLGDNFFVKQIAMGYQHTCALSTNNTIKCWGFNFNGQLGYGNSDDKGMTSNTMGNNLTTIDLGPNFIPKKIQLGNYHTCALSTTNTVKCWGLSTLGQTGTEQKSSIGNNINQMGINLNTTKLGSNFTVIDISVGGNHACAISNYNKVKCWGHNYYGQLGTGDNINIGDNPGSMGDNLNELIFPNGFIPKQIGCGLHVTCVLSTNNKIICFGDNSQAELATGDTVDIYDSSIGKYVDFGDGFIVDKLRVFYKHICILSIDNKMKCWGLNYNGQLGYGSYGQGSNIGDDISELGNNWNNITFPNGFIPIEMSNDFGYTHTCAVSMDDILCWGDNEQGQLCYGDTLNRQTIPGNLAVIDLCDTNTPTNIPTINPTKYTSEFPTHIPTIIPTIIPTMNPTQYPTNIPLVNNNTKYPTNYPTIIPTIYPTNNPTQHPTIFPTNIQTTNIATTSMASEIPKTEASTILSILLPISIIIGLAFIVLIIVIIIQQKKIKIKTQQIANASVASKSSVASINSGVSSNNKSSQEDIINNTNVVNISNKKVKQYNNDTYLSDVEMEIELEDEGRQHRSTTIEMQRNDRLIANNIQANAHDYRDFTQGGGRLSQFQTNKGYDSGE